jgi:hypothetical protein
MTVSSQEQTIVEQARALQKLQERRVKVAGELAEIDAEITKASAALRSALPTAEVAEPSPTSHHSV